MEIEGNGKYEISFEEDGVYEVEVKADARVCIDLGANKVCSNSGYIKITSTFMSGDKIYVENPNPEGIEAEVSVRMIQKIEPPKKETTEEKEESTSENEGGES